jgi:hypothetical protein
MNADRCKNGSQAEPPQGVAIINDDAKAASLAREAGIFESLFAGPNLPRWFVAATGTLRNGDFVFVGRFYGFALPGDNGFWALVAPTWAELETAARSFMAQHKLQIYAFKDGLRTVASDGN